MKYILILVLVFMLGACTSTGVVLKGDDTYKIEKAISRTFSGSPESVKTDVYQEAVDYCARDRKGVETIKFEITPGSGFMKTGNVALEFRCR